MSKRDPAVKIQIHVPANVPARASLAALAASNEAGRIVPAYEMHRRAYLAGLPLIEACAECRAGTCDGSKHVRQDNFVGPKACQNEPVAEATIHKTTEQNTAPRPVETTPAEQVGMFFTEPVEDKPAPEPKKRTRKPRVVTEDSPEHARLVDVYHVEFVRVRSEKPAYTSRDFAAFRALLKTHGFDRACELVRNAFADPWWSKRVTIQKINADPSTFAGTSAPVAVRRSGTTQDELPEAWQ